MPVNRQGTAKTPRHALNEAHAHGTCAPLCRKTYAIILN